MGTLSFGNLHLPIARHNEVYQRSLAPNESAELIELARISVSSVKRSELGRGECPQIDRPAERVMVSRSKIDM